ncbi:glycosyltransferase family 39 protein [Nostocaceae cyanobacterium CENA357]|uniref:Glycosyltransferase family 39 protein n=1 Tax=Atlanticothrix silvestris CENA357 TaxID=1725252 RepID=A0A8J7HIK9_9CYAN|nr:glycosyltransferase family 39 protein [Atlanticothrix silvestris]MBH8553105.1 glycosyltransferase family 39 protein [Atlanticothrix silvestris CENA357]
MRTSRLKSILFPLLTIFIYVGFVVAIRFKPITQSFELDYDEGLNLIKALLYSQGFSLYTQIWNDQPPAFTFILSHYFSLFGQSILAARLLTLIFSAILIYCFYQIVRQNLGTIPAFIATLLLFTSWLFIRLSFSVMIGIPALSLAMLSLYILTLYKQKPRNIFIILSGIFLALSIQTKLFTVFLIPLIAFNLSDFLIRSQSIKKQHQHLLYPLTLWLGTLSIIYLLIGWKFQQFFYHEQTFESHFNQPIEAELINFNNFAYLGEMIKQDYDYIFLAFIGILAIIIKKQRDGIFPLTWLGTAILILLNHKPLWYHHYPLLAIPICWLAAYAVAWVLDSFAQGWRYNLKPSNKNKSIFFSVVGVILIFLIIVTPPNPKGSPPKNLQLMQLVLENKSSTRWLFTDRPIYGFYANLSIPPEMAIMSYKRLNSGDLTFKQLLTILQKYQPEQIVLARWLSQIKSDNNIMAYINENYTKTYTDKTGTAEHYLIK